MLLYCIVICCVVCFQANGQECEKVWKRREGGEAKIKEGVRPQILNSCVLSVIIITIYIPPHTCIQALQKGNLEGARIHAENAIRQKNQVGTTLVRCTSLLVGTRYCDDVRFLNCRGWTFSEWVPGWMVSLHVFSRPFRWDRWILCTCTLGLCNCCMRFRKLFVYLYMQW